MSHGGPVPSQVFNPLSTCQNEGYLRVFPPHQTLTMVNARLPKRNLPGAMRADPRFSLFRRPRRNAAWIPPLLSQLPRDRLEKLRRQVNWKLRQGKIEPGQAGQDAVCRGDHQAHVAL